MLLDRQRAKFWQRIVFGFMAFLMGAFLIVGYSGVLEGCGFGGGGSTADSRYSEQVTAALAALKASPGTAAAVRAAAEAYQARGFAEADASQAQKRDLGEALKYYDQLLDMKDKRLGPDPKVVRIDVVENGRLPVHVKLGDAAGVAADYGVLTELQPKKAENFLDLGLWASQAGNLKLAYLAFTRYLEMEPESVNAPDIKARLKQIKVQINAEGDLPVTPSGDPTSGNE